MSNSDEDENGEDDVERSEVCGEKGEHSESDNRFKPADETCRHDDASLGVVAVQCAFFEQRGEVHPRGGVYVKG